MTLDDHIVIYLRTDLVPPAVRTLVQNFINYWRTEKFNYALQEISKKEFVKELKGY